MEEGRSAFKILTDIGLPTGKGTDIKLSQDSLSIFDKT